MWVAEGACEIEILDEFSFKIVSLNHAETANWLTTYNEDERCANRLIRQELGRKLVTDGAKCVIFGIELDTLGFWVWRESSTSAPMSFFSSSRFRFTSKMTLPVSAFRILN